MTSNSLELLSSLDGRYADSTSPLRNHLSEFAFVRDRVRVELDFLAALSKTGLFRPLTKTESAQIESIKSSFSLTDAQAVREHERVTRHDVKAIEYFLRDKFQGTSLSDLLQWIHFGITSEDVNNIAQVIELRDSRDAILLPALDALIKKLSEFAKQTRALPMLARTHGQFAVPTTLGKEFALYIARLKTARDEIASHRFEAKLSGAVGNLNALHAAVSQTDWLAFGKTFIQQFDLEPNLITTQILPYDNLIRYFDAIRLTNSILIDFSQDVWRYISDGILKQAVVAGEIGSSTMPQKVNPIDFENAEGNLGVANSLFNHYAQKLTVSRLQRDLSDSTVRRTFGTALGHTLLAWMNLQNGLGRIAANEEKIKADLNAHWEVIAEGAQTILRAAGRSDAYESLLAQTRGQVVTEADYRSWVEAVNVDEDIRKLLKNLSPQTYIGLAVQLTDLVLGK
jgi:adenylosuccinate lyase